MRLSRLLAAAGSATLFLGGNLLFGQDPVVSARAVADVPVPALAPPAHPPRPLTPQEQAILKKYDTNGDGKLEPDELAAAHGAAMQKTPARGAMARAIYDGLLTRFDVEHQGSLSAEEQARAVAALAADRPGIYQLLLRRFDRDGDGRLDAGETAALFHYFAALPPAGRALAGAPRPPAAKGPPGKQLYVRLLAGFDHAHTGSLTAAEQAEAVDYLQANAPGVYDRVLGQFDQNGDGKLDAAEIATMFATLATLSAPLPRPSPSS
jgi:Ca2+-binding EF-hand superfamily protein